MWPINVSLKCFAHKVAIIGFENTNSSCQDQSVIVDSGLLMEFVGGKKRIYETFFLQSGL